MSLLTAKRFASAFARSYLAYATDGLPAPFSASFAVTNRCNLRCAYCNTPFLKQPELALDDIEILFDRLQHLGITRLGIAGGEPLVRNDIGAILELAKARRFWISINSNLNLYKQCANVFEKVDLVFTSLDGEPERHKAQRGEKSLENTLDAIQALRAKNIPVVAICVVSEGNMQDLDYLLNLASDLDIKLHFQPQCIDTEIVRGQYPPNWNNDLARDYWRKLALLKPKTPRIASSPLYLQHLANWDDYRVSAVLDQGTRCAAGTGFLYIDPSGNAYPCAYTKGKSEPVNLLTQDWRKKFSLKTPCTNCIVGPMAEFNMLFRHPIKGPLGAAAGYA